MHFSCKITNAILSELEHRGEDLSPLYDSGFPPTEMLRDPTAWMSAPEMESFLEHLMRMNWARIDGSLTVEAGHSGPSHHVWGVLDSVLRMMPRPQEILHQPERFLSYFISPEPPIENLRRDEESLSFDLPLPAEQYPLVSSYLKAAFEALPLYSGHELARCEWNDIHLKIFWPLSQETMFEKDPGHQISPDLLQTVISDHQRLLRELEEKNRELQRKDEELQIARKDLEKLAGGAAVITAEMALNAYSPPESEAGYVIYQNLSRLHDYMVRAQQLVTVLSGFAKKEAGVKEVLRRTDWDQVKSLYPRAIAESIDCLRRLQQNRQPHRTEERPHV